MSSIQFNGVRFVAYPMDHLPRHVHGFYAGVEVIADLNLDRTVTLADRKDAVRPTNGKRSDVKHIVEVATESFDALVALWEKSIG